MAKFVISCPECGKYAMASTGLFAKKKVDCTCGYTINVKTDRIASTECSKCGNTVIYDQSKGDKAVCPVCQNQLISAESMSALVEFSCPSCSCRLSASKNAKTYSCPLCDTQIDVQNQVEKEKIKKQGTVSVIKYEGENDVFVWKHPIEDFNLGSQLIVHESQEALFFKDGQALDLFGAGRYTLATQNIPLLENLYKLPFGAEEVFHSEIYFINMTTQMGIKWGTDSKVRLFDPASGLHIEIGACGNFNLKVINSRKLLLKIVGTSDKLVNDEAMDDSKVVYSTKGIVFKFKGLVMNKVKSNLSRAIKECNINILEIDEYIDVLSDRLRVVINESLEEYGLTMPEFYITTINTPDDDPNYKRLRQQFADKTLKVREEEVKKAEAQAAQGRKIIEAQTEAQIKLVGAQAEAEAYKMQAFAEAEAMKAKGYTYQQETARNVSMEAMKNGITGGGQGMSMLGDIAGLGVTLGAMGTVMNVTKDVVNPVLQGGALGGLSNSSSNQNNVNDDNGWECPECKTSAITSRFCPNCGCKKPEQLKNGGWECPECGAAGITSRFCPNCGCKKPEQLINSGWECPECGTDGITSRFCPNCGTERK